MRGRAGTMTRARVSPRGSVVMMCGLPASGKTTTAERLHGYAGGVLIRSCDVYKELGSPSQTGCVERRDSREMSRRTNRCVTPPTRGC